jgi:hypothetical protein
LIIEFILICYYRSKYNDLSEELDVSLETTASYRHKLNAEEKKFDLFRDERSAANPSIGE